MSETVNTGVQPGHALEFGICTTGRPADLKTGDYTVIKDAEGLSISLDGGVETWNPMDQGGWQRALMTSKALSISMSAKRNYGDPGNDYVASLALKTGQDCNSCMKITFPNKDSIYIPCVVSVTSLGGESTALDSLEFDITSDGKPEYVTYVAA